MANTIDFKLRTIADLKGVNELKKNLNEVKKMVNEISDPSNTLYWDNTEILTSIKQVENALERAYNPNLDTVTFDKFNSVLKESNTDIQTIGKNLLMTGATGQKAFLSLTNTFTQMGTVTKRTNKIIDEMAQTMKNTVKWGLSSGAWNKALGSAQQAYGYIKNLDTALNDIRIVTGQSADQMRDFSRDANEAAKALAVSTRDYTEGALIYYQQGLDDDTVKALTDITAKTANVTGQSMAEVSEQLTAVWNGYNVANEAAEKGFDIYEEYVDKLAAVGAATASDLEELATAMSKVASSASMMGVNIDQLSAQVATIVSVTRQAPESVGTALKTIYARMGDLQVDGVDEFGTTLGEVSGTLESVGIKVLDETGNLREMGTVMEEVAEKWQGWTEAQRQAIAVAMAGKRQYNNLTALFNNWSMYQDTLAVSQNAIGTLNQQQGIALQSVQKRLEILRTTAEELYQDLFDSDTIKEVIDAATKGLNIIDELVKSFGGLNGMLSTASGFMLKMFSGKIAEGITNMRSNVLDYQANLKAAMERPAALEQFSQSAQNYYYQNPGDGSGKYVTDAIDRQKEVTEFVLKNQKNINNERQKEYELLNKNIVKNANKKIDYADELKNLKEQKNNLIDILSLNTDIEGSLEQQSRQAIENNKKLDDFKSIMENIMSKEGRKGFLEQDPALRTKSISKEYFSKDKRVVNLDETTNKIAEIFSDKSKTIEQRWGKIRKTISEINPELKGVNLSEFKKELFDIDDIVDNSIEELRTNLSTILKDKDVDPKILDNFFKVFREDIQEAIANGEDLETAFDNTINSLNRQNIDTSKLADLKNEIVSSDNAVNQFQKTLNEITEYQAAINNVTNLASSFLMLTSATQDIGRIVDVWSSDASIFEKITQTATNAVTAIIKITKAYGSLANAENKHSIAVLANTAAEKINATVKKIDELATKDKKEETEKSNNALDKSIDKINKETVALEKNSIAQKRNSKTRGDNSSESLITDGANLNVKDLSKLKDAFKSGGSFKESIGNVKNVLSSGELSGAIGNLTKSFGGLLKSLPKALSLFKGLIGPIAGVTAAIAAVKIGFKLYENSLNSAANAARKATKEQQEYTKTLQEQGEKIKTVTDGLNEVVESYQTTGEYTEDLRDKVFDLLIAYGDESDAVKALVGDYEDLIAIKNKYDNLEGEKAKETSESGKKQADYGKAELRSSFKSVVQSQGKHELDAFGGTYDLVGLGHTALDTENDILKRNLEDLGLDISGTGHVEMDNLIDVMANSYDELLAILQNSDARVAQRLLDYISNSQVTDALAKYQEGLQVWEENLVPGIASDVDTSSIKDVESYNKALDEMALKIQEAYKDSPEEITAEDAKQKALEYLSSIKDISSIMQQATIESQFSEALKGIDLTQAEKKALSEISDDEKLKVAISENINLLPAYKEKYGDSAIEEFISDMEDQSIYVSVEPQMQNIEKILSENGADTELTDEQLDLLYQDKDFEKFAGSKEDFIKENAAKQYQTILDYYNQIIEQANNLSQAESDILQKKKEQAKIDWETKISKSSYSFSAGAQNPEYVSGLTGQQAYENATESLNNFIDTAKDRIQQTTEERDLTKEQIDFIEKEISVLEELREKGYESLDEESKKYIKNVASGYDINEGMLKVWDEQIDSLDEFNDEQKLYSAQIKKGNKATKSNIDVGKEAAEQYQRYHTELSNASTELGNIQGAYNSLNSVMDSYNQNGFLTIDNLNTLLNMDDSYLAALQMQDGQMSLNQSQFESLANAQLNLAEASAVAEAMAKLDALANGEMRNSAIEAGNGVVQAANQIGASSTVVLSAVNACKQGAAAWNEYWAAATKGKVTSQNSKQVAEVGAALQTRLSAIENVRANLGKSLAAGSSAKGGGSSSKKEEEFTDDEVDRYWSVNKALEAINDELDKLEDKQSTMSGKQLIESLQEENKLLDQQIDKQKEKQKLQIQEAQEVQGRLKSFGVAFKDTGEITNYEAAYQAQINAYNAAVSAYNSGALDEAGMDIAKQKYEDFKKQIERYDTLLYDEMKDVADAISEEEKKQRENTLAIFEEDYKIKLDFSEAERDMQDFLAEMEEDFTKVYEDLGKKSKNTVASFSTYQGDNGTIAADLAAIGVVEREIMNLHTTGYSGMFETISQAQDRLKELQSDLTDHAKDMKDLFQDAWDAYMDGIDQAADKFENLMDEFDRINNNLEYQAELIELIYGEEAYDMMDKLYSAQISNSGVQIESLRQQKAFWAEQAEAAKQSYGEESEAYQEAYEKMRDCEQDLNDAVLDRINLIKDQYQNAVSSTIDALEKKITGGTTLDYMQDQWDRLKESADLYMDATEKAYNTETFKANVDQAIIDTKSVKAKQKLLEFQEKELKALREKKQLTQYDIDAANARFDILQKEIALEDAQNSKNTMKVTRNQEGNWTYQYVADEDDVTTKRQALLDSYKELYELSKTAYQSNIENLLKLDQEYLSKKKEYLEKYGADSQEMADLDKWYQEISMGYANEAATAKSGLQEAQLGLTLEIYKQDEEAYASMTSEQQRLIKEATDSNISDFNSVYDAVRDNMNDIVDSIESSLVEGRGIWDITADQMIDKWAGDDGSSVKAMVTDANDKLIEATQKYEEQVSDTADKAGQDFGPDGISGAIKEAEDETDNLKNKTAELASDSSSQLENLRNSVDQVKTAWEGVVQSIQDAINNIQQYLSLMQAAATASQTTFSGATNYGDYSYSGSDSSGGGNGSGGRYGGTNSSTISSSTSKMKYWIVNNSGDGNIMVEDDTAYTSRDSAGRQIATLVARAKTIEGKRKYTNYTVAASTKNQKKGYRFRAKTGGYTGNWPMSQGDGLDSDNGRLGILHQKELVLNASDTENILDAVKIVRSMPNIISSIQNAISDVVGERLSNMTNEIGQGKVVSTTTGSNKEENNVYNIVAEFPNANNAAEIEQALLNLKNIAAQKNGIRK